MDMPENHTRQSTVEKSYQPHALRSGILAGQASLRPGDGIDKLDFIHGRPLGGTADTRNPEALSTA